MSGPYLEHHLLVVAQVDPLGACRGQAPEVQMVTEPAPQEVLGFKPSSIIDGVAHSEVIATSSLRCHQTS
jgi:hypothetical protein